MVREGLLADSPMRAVRMPKLPKEILPPFTTADVRALLDACATERDRALILTLLDAGVRAAELLALNVGDVDLLTGAVRVRQGKGRKDRVTFVGARTRKALTKYLLTRTTKPTDPLFLTLTTETRLSFFGLQSLMGRGRRRGCSRRGSSRRKKRPAGR